MSYPTLPLTYPEERVDIAKQGAHGFLKFAEDMPEADAEVIEKFCALLEANLTKLIPTHRASIEMAKQAADATLPSCARLRTQFPQLDTPILKLEYLLKEAYRAVAADGLLSRSSQFRLYPNLIAKWETGETWSSSTPVYDTMGGNHNSTAARNRPRKCKVGDTIVLQPGAYPETRMTWEETGLSVPCDPSVPWTTLMARRLGEVVFRPKAGSKALYDEWRNWPICWKNIICEGGDPGAFMTENPQANRWYGNHPGFAPIRFENLKIDGSWNAEVAGDPPDKNKWGSLGYVHGVGRTKEEPGIECDGLEISGIWEEHAWYWHNLWSPHWDWIAARFRNFRIKHCGRTAFQHVARVNEGLAGQGRVIVEDGMIEDVCLQSGGGGSALTVAGRHYGAFEFSRVRVRLGCNPRLAAPRNINITGALVVYLGEGSENIPTSDVVVDQCDFEFGEFFTGQGSARRPLVKIGNDASLDDPEKVDRKVVERATIKRSRLKGWPGMRETINISSPTSFGTLTLDSKNEVIGPCSFAGVKYPTYAEMLNAINTVPNVKIL